MPRRTRTRQAALALVLLLGTSAGCPAGSNAARDGGDDDVATAPPDAGFDDAGTLDAGSEDAGEQWPAARTDATERIGSDATLDVATWNIENFPQSSRTPEIVADLIASMDLDLVAVEEIADVDAFAELVGRLPEHEGVLSNHAYGNGEYQKVGYIYRSSLLRLEGSQLLLTAEGYNLPRPPLKVRVFVDDGVHAAFDFTAIVVHHKAGTASEDIARRAAANVSLESWVRAYVEGGEDDEVLVLGDFNEVLTHPSGLAVMGPWLDAPALYRVETESLALAGEESFIPASVMLDHIVATAGLFDEIGGATPFVVHLENEIPTYLGAVSDHIPVVLRIPLGAP